MYLESTAATANWLIKGDTQAASVSYFNILPHSLQRLSYSNATLETVQPLQLHWPTRLRGSYGIGHRESITDTRYIGLYGFIDGSLDIGSLYNDQTDSTQHVVNNCYDRFFLNLNVGFEIIENPMQITVNIQIPLSAPFTRLEKVYLSTHSLDHSDCNQIIQTIFGKEGSVSKEKLQGNMQSTFYYNKDQYRQIYYYVEEGSFGFSIKAGYRFLNDLKVVSNGYCFYDPYRNFIMGFSTRLDYFYSQGLTLYTQYTYDAYRSWHVLGGMQFMFENRRLRQRLAYRRLWHIPDRKISPLLVRGYYPRPVNVS